MKQATSKLPPRQKTPRELEDRLLFESNHTCSVCHDDKAPDVQIHHISGRHRSAYDNLVVLCINCHSRIERGGGLGKGFTPGELRRYKTNWTKEISRRRKANMLLDREFATVAELEVRKLSYAFQSLQATLKNEERALEILSMIHLYARDFGNRVKDECLSAVYETCDWVQRGVVTERIASYQTSIVMEVLPIGIGGLVHPPIKALTKPEKQLISHAINIAGELAYAICKYVRSKTILQPAARLLYSVLKFSDINQLVEEKKQAMHEFAECIRISETVAPRGEFREGTDLLRELRELALDRS